MAPRPARPLRALVLTAGLGTRLRPLTDARAKAAIPVNGEPLARRIVGWLASRGIRDQILNLHHKPESIAAAIGDGSDLGVRVRYSWEQPVLGSAGGPRHALPLLADGGADAFLLVNGDTLTNVDIAPMIESHAASGALVTMAVIPNPRPDKYGGVAVAGANTVTGFPRAGSTDVSYHFVGVQVASPLAFEELPDGAPAESVGELYPRLMRERPGSVRAFVCEASFRDIGTPPDYLETSLALAAVEGSRLIGSRALISRSANLVRTVVWDDVVIGERASLTDCIVADSVRIPDETHFERCAIVPATRNPRSDEEAIDGLLSRRF